MTLHPVDAAERLLSLAEAGGSGAVGVVVGGPNGLLGRRVLRLEAPGGEAPEHLGSLGDDAADRDAFAALAEAIGDPRARDGVRAVGPEASPVELHVEIRRPVLELVIVGAGHIAQPMARLGSVLGYRVTVLDDRPDFATRERFPEADRLVRADFGDPFADVPLHARSHLLLVTRGHKYDYECLVRALKLPAPPAYIGMIGSRRRVRATYVQLLEEGIARDALERIHAPVGLDIGAETPEEIAVAVAAELVMLNRGGSGGPLKDVERVAERFFPDDSTP